MQFRPCIDIHNGKVKQIIGSSLKDEGNKASENYVCQEKSSYFANLFQKNNLTGGHIILLNNRNSSYYEQTFEAALEALRAYPGGMQVGGGITPDNAESFLNAGASHIIVTSYVFADGNILYDHLEQMRKLVGKEHLVLDLSCRRRSENGQKNEASRLQDLSQAEIHRVCSTMDTGEQKQDATQKESEAGVISQNLTGGEDYYVVTDRWQKFTDVRLNEELLSELSASCDEFLIHAVDVEGKNSGIDQNVLRILSGNCMVPVTYAGGIHCLDDIDTIAGMSKGKINVTIGSAMKMFGGSMELQDVLKRVEDINRIYF